MLKVGLLGAGRIAGVRATAISSHPDSTLIAVSDINTAAAEKLGGRDRGQAHLLLPGALHARVGGRMGGFCQRDHGRKRHLQLP